MRFKIIKVKLLFLLLLCYSILSVNAQELPPIQYYSPIQYGAENQNWDISQSANKYIYIANSEGLLEFNGSDWNVYKSPNETILRSVHVKDSKIYTGCYMEFGYWSKTSIGDLEYTSLSNKIKSKLIEDEQFWNIESVDDWLLFQSLNRIYIYNSKTEEFKIIDSELAILKMFKIENSIYFQDKTKGLMVFESSQPKLLSNHPILLDDVIVGLFKDLNGYVVITQNKGIYRLSDNTLNKISSSLDTYSIYSTTQLKDKSYVIGTISDGFLHVSETFQILNTIRQENGLGNNTVLSVFEDMDSNLWLGLDNGINCINMSSPFLIYNDDKGNLGTIYNSVLFNDVLYLGTNQGLFYKDNVTKQFSFIEGTKGQVWCLKIIDNQLFCGHNKGTFVITNNKAKLISNIEGTWDILPISNHPNLLLQGNFYGLNILEYKNNTWQFRNKIEGFNNSSRFIVFTNPNQVLVNHEYKGVFKIDIDSEFKKTTKVETVKQLKKGLFSSLTKHKNSIYYTFKDGVLQLDKNTQLFKVNTQLTNIIKNQGYDSGRLISDPESNTLWMFTKKGINCIKPGKLSKQPDVVFIPLSSNKRESITGYESISSLGNNRFILGTSKGYKILDISQFKAKAYKVNLNSIKINPLTDKKELIDITTPGDFKNKNNNIEISYSVAEYDKYLNVEYATKLVGFYDNWSEWSDNSSVSYKNLPYGDYTFKVKARVGDKDVQDAVSYNFTIQKPWYLSNYMVIVYFVLGFGIVLLVNYIYKQYYKKQKQKLLLKTQRELELKDLENKQHLMKLNNEKLKNEIESKNRELAISTMSLIKKNEFLNTIKKELNDNVKTDNLKPVIKIIDKNINNKNDWKLFEEAFNNADKDFLKKIKAIHPKLTSNDLRLCAYLRLNLSSKEIAPLLNISPRSVEVKRYRLRKKMDLEHETSLTDYILQL